MNEPANFVAGSTTGCTDNNLDNPPYTPGEFPSSFFSRTLQCNASEFSLLN